MFPEIILHHFHTPEQTLVETFDLAEDVGERFFKKGNLIF